MERGSKTEGEARMLQGAHRPRIDDEAPKNGEQSPNRGQNPRQGRGRGLGRGLGEPLPKKIFEILKVQRCNLEAFGSVILLL